MKKHRHIDWLAELVRPQNYASMLVTSVTMILIAPLVDNTPWGRVLMFLLVILSMLSGTVAISDRKHEKVVGVSLAGLAILFLGFASIFEGELFGQTYFWLIGDGLALLFFLVTGTIMLRDIFSGEVTGNRICGAICVYLLLGLSFAILHQAVLMMDPHSLRFEQELLESIAEAQQTGRPRVFSMLIYYSFCTLSTLGFGDISPVGTVARTLSWMEAVCGQMYLTILVARLVGQYGNAKSRSAID